MFIVKLSILLFIVLILWIILDTAVQANMAYKSASNKKSYWWWFVQHLKGGW